jgi:hypothetical protein
MKRENLLALPVIKQLFFGHPAGRLVTIHYTDYATLAKLVSIMHNSILVKQIEGYNKGRKAVTPNK